jgi:hypothetical protein
MIIGGGGYLIPAGFARNSNSSTTNRLCRDIVPMSRLLAAGIRVPYALLKLKRTREPIKFIERWRLRSGKIREEKLVREIKSPACYRKPA